MKKMIITGVVAGAAAAAIIALMYRRNDGSTYGDYLLDSAKDVTGKLKKYGQQIKDRLLNNEKGPNGEDLYLDMYNRKFYEDMQGQRVYLDA